MIKKYNSWSVHKKRKLIMTVFTYFGLVDNRVKGCVCYIFASLFYMSKREHLQNKEKCLLFHFESSSCSWDNQLLIF